MAFPKSVLRLEAEAVLLPMKLGNVARVWVDRSKTQDSVKFALSYRAMHKITKKDISKLAKSWADANPGRTTKVTFTRPGADPSLGYGGIRFIIK